MAAAGGPLGAKRPSAVIAIGRSLLRVVVSQRALNVQVVAGIGAFHRGARCRPVDRRRTLGPFDRMIFQEAQDIKLADRATGSSETES